MTKLVPNITDQHMKRKLQEIVPELRRNIQDSVRNRLSMNLERVKQQKKIEIQQLYQKKLQSKLEEVKSLMRDSLSNTLRNIDMYKKQKDHRNKQKIMNGEEEKNCIDKAVEELLADQKMVGQIKNEMRQTIQIKLRANLQSELEEEMERAKRQLIGKLKEERDQWTEERIAFWKRQSDLELNELATEHNELNNKKANIEGCLNAKKMQKSKLQQKLRATIEQNALVASLRSQLKILKTQIH